MIFFKAPVVETASFNHTNNSQSALISNEENIEITTPVQVSSQPVEQTETLSQNQAFDEVDKTETENKDDQQKLQEHESEIVQIESQDIAMTSSEQNVIEDKEKENEEEEDGIQLINEPEDVKNQSESFTSYQSNHQSTNNEYIPDTTHLGQNVILNAAVFDIEPPSDTSNISSSKSDNIQKVDLNLADQEISDSILSDEDLHKSSAVSDNLDQVPNDDVAQSEDKNSSDNIADLLPTTEEKKTVNNPKSLFESDHDELNGNKVDDAMDDLFAAPKPELLSVKEKMYYIKDFLLISMHLILI